MKVLGKIDILTGEYYETDGQMTPGSVVLQIKAASKEQGLLDSITAVRLSPVALYLFMGII